MQSIHSYLVRTEQYSTLRYILEMTAIMYVLKIIFALIFFIITFLITGVDVTQLAIQPEFNTSLIISAVVIAPLLETIFGQMIPIWVTNLFIPIITSFTKQRQSSVNNKATDVHKEHLMPYTTKRFIPILVSTIFFTLMHQFASYGAILPVAFILAWTYEIKKKESVLFAFSLTAFIHALHNFIAILFLIV